MDRVTNRKHHRLRLGRIPLDDQLERSIEDTGLLEIVFRDARPDASVLSEDGNRTVASMAPSGGMASLLVQDYANGESRRIPFSFGLVDIINDGEAIEVFLISPPDQG
jgi:hypothetical protein